MITFKRATENDIDFIREAIIEAEKSGTDRLSYATVFDYDTNQVNELIKNALLEDIPGQELGLSGFIVAYIQNEYAGTVCSWIEAADGIPSAMIKANVLYYFLGQETILRASSKATLIEALNIPRAAGTLQIESVYVCNKYRGLGVSNKLIMEHIKDAIQTGVSFSRVQIHVAETNEAAIKSYLKLGFKTIIRKKCEDPSVLKILPSDTRIMMELNLDDLYKNKLLE